jgi:hypothetical protein
MKNAATRQSGAGDYSSLAIRELKRLLRFFGERAGAPVCSERMEGAADARYEIRSEIRNRIRLLLSNNRECKKVKTYANRR